MADASARVTGEVGVFSVVPGPGLTNAMTGIGEALLDSVPIVGIVTDVDRAARTPRSARSTGCPTRRCSGRSSRRCSRSATRPRSPARSTRRSGSPGRASPGPVARRDPVPLLHRGLGLRPARPAPLPRPVRRGGLPARRSACLADRQLRVGHLRGAGLPRRRPGAGGGRRDRSRRRWPPRSAARGASPTRHPLAVGWGYGKQGTRAAERAFKDVDLVLAVGVRYSEVSTANYAIPQARHADPRRRQPEQPRPERPRLTSSSAPTPGVFLDRLLADAAGDPPPALPAALAEDPARPRSSTAARTPTVQITAASTRWSS